MKRHTKAAVTTGKSLRCNGERARESGAALTRDSPEGGRGALPKPRGGRQRDRNRRLSICVQQ
jgi:hypothetical protein